MNKNRIPAYDESMKTLVCFVAGTKNGDSFFTQLKQLLTSQYRIEKKEVFQNEDEQIVCLYVKGLDVTDFDISDSHSVCSNISDSHSVCSNISDSHSACPNISNGNSLGVVRWLLRRILLMKQKKYLRTLGMVTEVYHLPDKKVKPPEVASFCVFEFLEQITYEKNTILGIIDGGVLDYKIWVKLLRRYLDKINGLMIISDKPERFVELYRDAWEQQGLAITLTKNKKELAFCDYVIDCSDRLMTEKIMFRKPCLYLMLSEHRKKSRQLCMQNEKLRIVGCVNFCEKI